MKGEASSRIINGKECKFAIEDLEKMPNQTSQWDGVCEIDFIIDLI